MYIEFAFFFLWLSVNTSTTVFCAKHERNTFCFFYVIADIFFCSPIFSLLILLLIALSVFAVALIDVYDFDDIFFYLVFRICPPCRISDLSSLRKSVFKVLESVESV